MSYKRQMEQRARERAAEREGREAEGQQGATAAVPAPGGEVDPLQSPAAAAVNEAYRPQPFTPDLIPEPEKLDAQGPMSAQEIDELAHCEAAYTNANQAEWLKWKAAHAVRERKTHRGPDGTRTWPEYCDEKFGESESEVNRSIQQWPLMKAISEQWTRPLATPASHVQALLPVIEGYGLEETARDYVTLRTWAAENKKRVTAADLETWVDKAQAVQQPGERPALTAENWMAAREERVEKAKSTKARPAAQPSPGTPAVGAAAGVQTAGEEASHPNLGDSGTPASDEQPHQEPDDAPTEEAPGPGGPEGAGDQETDDGKADQAAKVWSELEGMHSAMVMSGLLQHARTDTLTSIAQTARAIAEAAEEVLKER
ncbi:hypothetical protein [Streptomyces natalensis]|uniref:Uncharacterized protein n=1 Tax=Streptomyces natalensis ATCC 27448 TaxID=1240678 RepID=A0A0D7CHT8_9ACTN|nr:hypothetical protein [Streptomyces natalensis]KIZ15626.1 hypothetical protein SNA_25715 [Streptomyces natalensis ATCC 27448]